MTNLKDACNNIHAINNASRLEVRTNGGVKMTTWEFESWLDEISKPASTPSAETFELNPTI